MQAEVKRLGLPAVPFLGTLELDHTIDQLIDYAAGKSVLNEQTEREGVVLRLLVEESHPDTGGRLSLKTIIPK